MVNNFQTLNLDSGLRGGETRLHQRKQIAILHQNDVPARQIAWFLQNRLQLVKRWLIRIESEETISDRPRSGQPATFTEDICLKVIAFYCQKSPLPGSSSWSLRWAEKYLKEHSGIINCPISHSGIQRILKMHALRSHKQKYFLQITDPEFFPHGSYAFGLIFILSIFIQRFPLSCFIPPFLACFGRKH